MAFASPSASARKILSVTDTATTGTATYNFTIPQDSDTLVAKFWTNTFTPTTTNAAQVTIQTTEDGGSTWRDVAACTIQAAINNDKAHFAQIPCIGSATRGVSQWVGSVAASTLALAATASVVTGTTSGLPMMGTLGRVYINYTGTITANTGVNVDLFAPTTQIR